MKSILLNVFNVKQEEVNGLLLMMIHALFNGLGIALSYTAINILIIDNKMVSKLPILYIGCSVLLLIVGYYYAKLEHKYSPSIIFKGVLAFGGLWSLILFLNLSFSHSTIMVTIAFVTYFIIYLLNNLEFWGAAALIFNVRQGKRLFGLLAVGESVAKIIGYSLTPIVISLFDIQYVFLGVFLSFIGSYFIFRNLIKLYKEDFEHAEHEHDDHEEEHISTGIAALSPRRLLRIDDFTKYISIFALVATLCYFLLQFTFLDQIKYSFKNLKDIAIFFALLFSVAKFLNLLIKVFVASRLLQYLGLKFVLLLLPVVLLFASSIGLIGVFNLNVGPNYLIWVFAIIIVIDETLRSSLYTPSYLLLFQPLSKPKRLEGHTLSKGIMEPIGIGLAGLCILILHYFDLYDLKYLIMLILAFIVIWIFAGSSVFKAYIGELQNALKSKLLHRGTLDLSKEEIQSLKNRLQNNPSSTETIYLMQLLEDELSLAEKTSLIEDLLKDENPFVTGAAMDFCGQYKLDHLIDQIESLITHSSDLVSDKAIEIYALLKKESAVNFFKDLMENIHPDRKKALISSSIKNGGLHGAVHFGGELLNLLKSKKVEDRVNGAHIIRDIGINEFYYPLLELLKDPSHAVKKAALEAAIEVQHPNLLIPILHIALEPSLFGSSKRSINAIKHSIKEELSHKILHATIPDKVRLLRLVNRRRKADTEDIVFQLVHHTSFEVKREAIRTIYIRDYPFRQKNETGIRQEVREIIRNIRFLLKFGVQLEKGRFRDAVFNEIMHIQLHMIFYCLSYLYAKHQIVEIIENANIEGQDFRSNALELLENLLSAKDKRMVIPTIEQIYEMDPNKHEKAKSGALLFVLEGIIKDRNQHFSSWLLANALRTIRLENFDIQLPVALYESPHSVVLEEINAFNIMKK